MLADEDTTPKSLPSEFSYIEGEPEFDPVRHLALEIPEQILSLEDFGYSRKQAAQFASPVAATSPVRILSDEGIAATQAVLDVLQPRVVTEKGPYSSSGRKNIYFGQYQSRFLRDLMACRDVTEFLSDIYQTPLAAHTMGHLGCQINFGNEKPGGSIIGWHHDIVGFTVVLTMHDPSQIEGGHLVYFKGPRDEGERILKSGDALPEERVVISNNAPMGYATTIQGSAVLHAVQPLVKGGYRCSIVNAYVSRDVSAPDANRAYPVDGFYPDAPMHQIYNEMARHAAWLGKAKLGSILESENWSEDREQVIAELNAAIEDVGRCIEQLKMGGIDWEQYEKSRIEEDERQMTAPLFAPGAQANRNK